MASIVTPSGAPDFGW
jgi:cytochrome c oxidase subunit I